MNTIGMPTHFSIDTYDRKYLEGMTTLYNAETAFESHIAPLTPDRFVELVERKSYFDAMGVFIAVEANKVVGWIHACVAPGSERAHDPARNAGRIRMLIFPSHRLKIGHALVAEATRWLKGACGETELLAMDAKVGYPFYRGLWMGGEPMGPATMAHVQLAFEVGGYKNTQESIFMTATMDSPPKEVHPDVSVTFVEDTAPMWHEPMHQSWVGFEPRQIQSLVADVEAGGIGYVLQPHLAARLGALCVNIWSLGVGDRFRRKGIAAALVSRVMALSYAKGARFASVGTQLWNRPAHATYAKFGFRPHCILIGRTLETTGG